MRDLPVPDPGTPDRRGPLRFLMWVARTQPRTLAGGVALGTLWTLSQALMPAVVGKGIDAGIVAKDSAALLEWSAILLALGAVQAVTGIWGHRFAVTTWLSAAYQTIQVVTRQATRLGATLPKRLTTGEVVSVGVADMSRIGDLLEVTGRAGSAVVAIVVVSTILLVTSPPLGLIVLVGVPLIVALAGPLLRPMHHRQQRARDLAGELNTRAADIVAGLRVLRGIGGERVFGDRYREESQRLRRAGVAVARAESMLSGAEVLLPGLLIAGVTWLGAHFALDGRISVGQLVAFYGFAVFLIGPMRTLGETADKLTKAHVSAGRVIAILNLDPESPTDGTRIPAPGAALHDPVSGLTIRPGSFTAIVAADPVDAQSIADRLGGYGGLGPGECVTYGGVPLAELADLRRRILVSINDDRIFSGRLRDMLAGAGAGGAETGAERTLDRAVHTACAEDIVEAVGLDAHVAEGGRDFSGGQQQRLRLARALTADPEVLVLVDPTSAVDAHTEARIAGRLAAARAGRTTVVCATSPLVLDRADRVAYIENGRVAAEGTHRELLSTYPSYTATVTREDPVPMIANSRGGGPTRAGSGRGQAQR